MKPYRLDHVVAWIAETEEELNSLQAESPAPAAGEEISRTGRKNPYRPRPLSALRKAG